MALLTKVDSSTILENIVASVILMTVFILAGNAINNVFKTNLNQRDLEFDNQVRKTEYFIFNNKIKLPQFIEVNGKTASFTQKEHLLVIEINKGKTITKTKCCLEKQ